MHKQQNQQMKQGGRRYRDNKIGRRSIDQASGYRAGGIKLSQQAMIHQQGPKIWYMPSSDVLQIYTPTHDAPELLGVDMMEATSRTAPQLTFR